MAEKSNIRSIRFSNEVAEIIDQQQGNNFTEKFDRLIYNCYMLKSEKEKEVKLLDDLIKAQRKRLDIIRQNADELQKQQREISTSLLAYDKAVNKALANIKNL